MNLNSILASSRARSIVGLTGAIAISILAACSTTAEPLSESGMLDEGGSDGVDDGSFDTGHDDRGESGDAEGTDVDDDGPHYDVGDTGGIDLTPGIFPECPRPLPPHWVFCADFEDDTDLAETFFEYQDADGAFVPVDGDAASGLRSMEATYKPGVEGAGWLSVAFGRNPIVFGAAPHYSESSDFQEIHWRLRVKMEAGWPDIGPDHLSRAAVFAGEDWLQAMSARLRSDGASTVLVADPTSCVNGDVVACSAYEDAESEKSLGALAGAFPLFSSAESGEWHCVEARVKLDSPGAADGVLEFWIDGELQNSNYELDWLGGWSGFGLNLVTIDNRWTGGAPQELRRKVDDLVIATERIGCE